VPQLIGNTAEEGKLFSSAFKVDDYTRVKWMNGTYLGTTTGLQLQDVVDATIVSPLTVDNYNTYTFNNANGVVPAPSITTAAFWGLSNASNTAYYPQVPLYAYNFKWNEQPPPWNDVYGAWHAEDLAFIFGNFTMNLEAFGGAKPTSRAGWRFPTRCSRASLEYRSRPAASSCSAYCLNNR